jgi:hypothetical protein
MSKMSSAWIRAAAIGAIASTLSAVLLAQVPAGLSYDPGKHPNPIVTWVQTKDFKPTTYLAAMEAVGVDTMSLSQDLGRRESVELATPTPARQKIRIFGAETEVTFYPVMRQNYKLKSGRTFVLYTFRFPRALTTAELLNAAAFERHPRGTAPRFGSTPIPDRIEIRDSPGLYFEIGMERIMYWFELGAGHTAISDATRDEFLDTLDDLL